MHHHHSRTRIVGMVVALLVALPLWGCGDDDTEDIVLTNCGNGVLDGNEECDDGNTLDSDDCLSTCRQATCGDGFIKTGAEDCDGINLGGKTCNSLGLQSGTLRCNASCDLDTSGCGSGPNPTPTPGASTPTETPTGGETPSPAATSTPSGPACVAGDQITVTVSLDTPYAGADSFLSYPASVRIPGQRDDDSVKQRVTFLGAAGFSSVNDQDSNGDSVDDRLQTSYLQTSTDNPAGGYIRVVFDCVEGQTPPSSSAFSCTVSSASDVNGNPLDNVQCSIVATGP